MNDTQGVIGWILAGVGTIISTLSGLVAYFYRQQVAGHHTEATTLRAQIAELRARCDKCDLERERLAIECAQLRVLQTTLEDRLSQLEGKTNNG